MDIQPSSTKVLTDPEPADHPKESDAELLAWAKKRGYVSFGFFFLIALAVAVAWTLTR